MAEETTNNSSSDSTLMKVLSYFGILWLIPFFLVKGEARNEVMVGHLKQGFGCMVICLLGSILHNVPFVGSICSIVGGILSLIGIIYAVIGKNEKLPIVGNFFDSTFSFIK